MKPIKALIDDYDLMNCFLSNNLQDFAEAMYVVSGFQGDDLSKLRQNVKAKKVVGTGSDGGIGYQNSHDPYRRSEDEDGHRQRKHTNSGWRSIRLKSAMAISRISLSKRVI